MNPDELPIEKSDSPFPFDEIIESDRPQTDKTEAIESSPLSEPSEVSLVEQLIEEISHDTPASAVSESLQPKLEQLTEAVSALERRKQTLEAEIVALREQKSETIAEQVAETQAMLAQMVREAMKELEGRSARSLDRAARTPSRSHSRRNAHEFRRRIARISNSRSRF
jgi:chaperonin cofactor prefoldin